MLNNSGKSVHSYLVPDLRRNAFSFSPLRIMFAVDLSYIAFTMLRYIPSMPIFWRVLIINGCWILSKAFSASIEMIIWFLSFDLLIWYIILIALHILKNPCILGINPTWSWHMSCLMCCWILFAKVLLRIFTSIFLHLCCNTLILACSFLFCVVFVWFWYQSDSGLVGWVWKCSFFCDFFERVSEG